VSSSRSSAPSTASPASTRSASSRWKPIDDTGDLAGYRVYRDGRTYGSPRRQAWLAVAVARAHAGWSVAAVDTSGNAGPRSRVVHCG
jgi:hypothetical protein